jgi:tyrosine-protein kinase Etk/Wzc
MDKNAGEEGLFQISLLDIVGFLFRNRKLVIITTAIATAIALAAMVLSMVLPPNISYLPNLYTSRATMLISEKQSNDLSSLLSSSGLSSLAGLAGVSAGKNYGELAVYLAKSDPILDSLSEKFSLRERYRVKRSPKTETRKKLLKKFHAGYNDKTGVLTLSFDDYDAVFAKDVVDYAVGLMDARFSMIGGNKYSMRKDQLEIKLADVQVEIANLEEKIKNFQIKYGVLSVEGFATEQLKIVAKVRSELILKEIEIKTHQAISPVEDPVSKRLMAERNNLLTLLNELDKGFSEYEDVMPSQKDLPGLAIEFSHLQRDYMVQSKIYEILIQQYELTKLALTGEDPILQVLAMGEPADKKSAPSRGMFCVVAAMAAFFSAIALAVALDIARKVRGDPESMRKLRGIMK